MKMAFRWDKGNLESVKIKKESTSVPKNKVILNVTWISEKSSNNRRFNRKRSQIFVILSLEDQDILRINIAQFVVIFLVQAVPAVDREYAN
jgi:hypothetical protein